jgi:tetratricopeptide (TPR) repeat protein
MKANRLYSILTIVLLLLFAGKSYGQYQPKQIDSLLDLTKKLSNAKGAIEIAKRAFDYSKAIDYKEGMVKALLVCANKSNNSRNYDEAFKYTVQAETLAKELNDPWHLANCYSVRGEAYTQMGLYAQGKTSLNQAISIAETISDPGKKHYRLGHINSALGVNNYMAKGSLSKSKDFFVNGYLHFLKIPDRSKFARGIGSAASNVGAIFISLKQFDSAAFYLKKSIVFANETKDSNSLILSFVNLGEVYYSQGNFKTAEKYYKTAESYAMQTNDLPQLKSASQGLAKTYTALGNKTLTTKYLQQATKLVDSLAFIKNKSLQTPLNYLVKEKEQQLDKSQSQRSLILIITGISLLGILIFIFSYRRKHKKQMSISSEKMDELLAKMNVDEDSRHFNIETLKEAVQLAATNNPAFILKFNELHPDFCNQILQLAPNMVASEIEFCAMLRLNFETKEIARYTKSSVRAVESKKYRIRKKLSIPSNQDIFIWMTTI